MVIPTSKPELLHAIDTTFDRLMADLARVPPASADERTMPGHAAGTVMSPADLVAYLVGWNERVLDWLANDDAGQPVAFPAPGYGWNQLGELAQAFYAADPDLPWPERLDRLGHAKAQLVATITARPDAELYGQPWYGKHSKGRMIQLNTAAPYANARTRLRKWLRDTPPNS